MSGLHGLATSFARVPFEVNLDSTLIKGGPMATTTVDAALTYALIAPNEPGHFYSELYDGGVTGLPQPHLAKFHDISDLTGVRIGLYEEMFNDSLPHIRDRAYEVVRFLQEKGAEIVPITIPHLQSLRMAHGLKIGAEFALGFDGAFHAHPSG
jgi:Asp-tRNA(Asn)/Glu-tRNA(Gln) amidotransferase A subunit family amidase